MHPSNNGPCVVRYNPPCLVLEEMWAGGGEMCPVTSRHFDRQVPLRYTRNPQPQYAGHDSHCRRPRRASVASCVDPTRASGAHYTDPTRAAPLCRVLKNNPMAVARGAGRTCSWPRLVTVRGPWWSGRPLDTMKASGAPGDKGNPA